jgi:predicted RNA-binding Zn ribbon-like protein
LRWIEQAGLPVANLPADLTPGSVVHAARMLRENIRALVEKRKAGQRGDPSILNAFLAEAQSHPRLVWNEPRSLAMERVRQQGTPWSILAPVAEAAADLLATCDFTLVKRCEDRTCVLWFADQTKSHHRRWCSTALCGNRHKVAAYRKRRRARE